MRLGVARKNRAPTIDGNRCTVFAKEWTQWELDGLVQQEAPGGVVGDDARRSYGSCIRRLYWHQLNSRLPPCSSITAKRFDGINEAGVIIDDGCSFLTHAYFLRDSTGGAVVRMDYRHESSDA